MSGVLSRGGFCVVLVASMALEGCGGQRGSARSVPSTTSTSAMAETPKSISPGSFKPAPMPHAAVAPAMPSVRHARSSIQPISWTQLPGAAVRIAASPGSLWVLGTQTNGTDYYIYRYVNGSWTNIQGLAKRIAVGPDGNAWVVTAVGDIYHYNGSSFVGIAGGANDISVGADGSVYVISNQNLGQYGWGIWHYVNGTWTQLPGAGVRIAASWDTGSYPGGIAPGGFYVLNAPGSIYYYNPATGTYNPLSGTAAEIAPTQNGGIFTLAYPADTTNGTPISYEDLATGTVTSPPGSAVSITTDSSFAYLVGRGNAIYKSSALQPPPTGPAHVATWYYYGGEPNGANHAVPMSWLGQHATYIENDGDAAANFKAAGGTYVMRYTDPAFADYCDPPFGPNPPAKGCISLTGKYITNEAGWFHGSDGARVNRFYSTETRYQEAMNPQSQQTLDAYHTATSGVLAEFPQVDYFFADDSGGTYIGYDGTPLSGHFYGFNAAGVEITTDTGWINAFRPMLAAAVKPVLINGVDPATQLPAYNGALLDAPNVMGAAYEGCYSWGTGVAGYQNNRWHDQQNGLLATMRHQKIALCMMTADATPLSRLYEMASWWLTYSEQFSVAAPIPNNHLDSVKTDVMPEYDIVPRQPRATATNDISELSSSTGAFVREFAACYQFGAPIGPCAAVVNPTAGTVAIPALTGSYTTMLVLNAQSAISGGTATWSASAPTQLSSLSAAILR